MNCYQYYPNFINSELDYLNILVKEIELQQDYLNFDGTLVKESRLTSWQTETNNECNYGGKTLAVKKFTPTVKKLKRIIEDKKNVKLDSVLINYYQDGNDHINYHSDEYNIHKNNDILVLSFGESRKFVIRNKENHQLRDNYLLNNGDLFHMFGKCQDLFDHSVRREKKEKKLPRISLSFRNLGNTYQ